jgi:hypothetical protein
MNPRLNTLLIHASIACLAMATATATGCGSSKGSQGTGTAGGGGTTGAAGTGTGTAGTTGAGGSTTAGDQSVLQRNLHASRDGAFVQPGLTKTAAATMAPDASFAATFPTASGEAMWASPLYLQNGPAGKGVFFAVTTQNNVYALDETSGAQVWMHNIGSSPTANGGSPTCGNIHPLGILSTPVIDAGRRTIYVAGAIGTNSIMSHEIHALSVDDGTEKSGWPVNASTATSGSITFDTVHENQRGALSLVGTTLYVPYGGHIGDCGNYHGWVIGVDTTNPTNRGAWATGGIAEGIWAAGGMASDGNGVFASTGNREPSSDSSAHQDSEEVVRVTGLGTLSGTPFYPSRWHAMDMQDADMSSNNPVYVELAGATPSKMVVQISKDGHLYVLDAANLGGSDGFKVDFTIASGAMSIHSAPGSYKTAMGTYIMVSTDSGAQCPAGSGGGQAVMAVRLSAANPPVPTVAWCSSFSGKVTAPIATTTDGLSNPIVWFMNNGKLTGVDGDTGTVIFSGGSGSCSGVQQWTSPIAANNRIVVGGNGHLCSWSPQ